MKEEIRGIIGKKIISLMSLAVLGILAASLVLLGYVEGASQPKQSNAPSQLVQSNPFALPKYRIVPGTTFEINVDKTFNREKDKVWLAVIYRLQNDTQTKRIPITNFFLKQENDKLMIRADFPGYGQIRDIRTQSPWRGVFSPFEGDLEIKYEREKGDLQTFLFRLMIPSVKWAYIWGIVVAVASFFIISRLKPDPIKKHMGFEKEKDKTTEEWEKKERWKKLLLYPLNFAITPMGSYSISLTQIIIWTYVTIFGLVYVYSLTGSFLDITPQVLMLLGIGGGTAITSKINSISKLYEVPPKYLNLVEKKRVPQLRDLISTAGNLNVFKFQILVFTLLVAYVVVLEIAKKYSFPQIPENLIILMGISSAVYLGNEVTQKNVWEKIKKKVEDIEKNAKERNILIRDTNEVSNSGIPEVGELKEILSSIYS